MNSDFINSFSTRIMAMIAVKTESTNFNTVQTVYKYNYQAVLRSIYKFKFWIFFYQVN